MGKLEDIYSSVENPLDNEEILKKILYEYSKSDRTIKDPGPKTTGTTNLYNALVSMNGNIDNSQINMKDKEKFYIKTYNQWIENILGLDDAHIQYLETQKMKAGQMQQYLRNFGKVSSLEDISRLKSNPLFAEPINGWELFDGWDHIKSQYISGRTEKKRKERHRLYIGCQNQDMWKLAELFKSKCDEEHTPFYFKVAESINRDDKMVIYADTDSLGKYISILQEIEQENPEIIQRCGKPPMITGKVNEWVGIGDEPPQKENGKNQSYNQLRARIFEDSIEQTLLNHIADFRGKDVIYNGKQTKFNEVFMEQAVQTKLTMLAKKNEFSLKQEGLKASDLENKKFKEYMIGQMRKQIQKGLDKLEEVKDSKEQLMASNGEAIFKIPTKEGKSLSIDTYDMDAIIKSMVPIMQEIDPTFMDDVRAQIQQRSKQKGIDDTFCFQQGTKERFKQIDSKQLLKPEMENTTENSKHIKKEVPVKNAEAEKGKTTNTIKSIDIVNMLNPALLGKQIELPNGTRVSARQYIQEAVAPRIPSNGKFILNNGVQLSAKQYIEDYILSEGQEKYKGDIGRLLEENTKSNNGTISLNGKEINAIDIVENINPELLKHRMKLPNGAEISATQYIQEVVAPHIPSDGKFILKSNGGGISATQFIEEIVMHGQEEYNGDIDAILEAYTIANNGTIEIEKTKDAREKRLQQEMGEQITPAQKEEREQEEIEAIEFRNDGEHRTLRKDFLKSSIMSSKVTTDSYNKSQKELRQDIKETEERKEFQQLMFLGSRRTAEQQRRFEELNNQISARQVQQQSNGMEM